MRTEAQKAADKKYAQKIQGTGKYTRFSTTLPTEEAKALNEALKKAGMSKTEFIRRAYDILIKGVMNADEK